MLMRVCAIGLELLLGDVHVHFFGMATLSFADGITTQDGDEFEIEAAPFGRALRNRLKTQAERKVTIRSI
ncbi:hypothetical protein [Thalassospira xiamenensis]|uniref:hypothetical protein n=1 Tax=Thalassospira xiamenensis TaxID=220697 RepID=UPI0024956F72|nr:hypothetical protein [Thalassospira xiamenensis]